MAEEIQLEPLVTKRDVAAATSSNDEPNAQIPTEKPRLSLSRASLIIGLLTGITTASSMTTGLLAVALPRMAIDLDISEGLLLWPASIYGLTCGCTLLITGSIADVIGSKFVYLTGCFLLSLVILACGLSQNATQLIVFRGLQGVCVSCCLPTAMSLLTMYLEKGKRRNAGFAFIGAGQPVGYSVGMFIGGFFVDSVGWRYAWYFSAIVAMIVFIGGAFGLPNDVSSDNDGVSIRSRLGKEIDWIGAIFSSACLGLLSYVLAVISSDPSNVKKPSSIVIICIAVSCIPLFVFWMHRQTKTGRAALIPNHLWRKTAFSSICFMVFIIWGAVSSIEYFFSLYFQKIQGLSAVQSSIRFVPNIVLSVVLSLMLGAILHRASAYWIILTVCFLSTIAPLLMAITDPDWPYWYTLFTATAISSLAGDVLFVISALVITSNFPSTTQALASAVFNTASQFGTAVGLALISVISSTVTTTTAIKGHTSPSQPSVHALLEGYKAGYWTMFGSLVFACGVGAFGLRGVSRMGLKSD